jgi:hypothetical protein
MNWYIDFLSMQPPTVYCGLEQGYTLSPFLFSLAFEYAVRLVLLSENELK